MLMPVRAEPNKTALRFVLVPKVTHLWFEEVRQGALAAARMITSQATVEQQQAILSRAINYKADGIFIDLLDASRLTPLLTRARAEGIQLAVFDSEATADPAWATTTASRPRLPLSAW